MLADFIPAQTDVVGDREVLDRLDERDAREAVGTELLDVIAVEAPVQVERLARIVANRFGLSRVRQNRLEEIIRLIPDELCVDTPFGVYAWRSEEQYQTWGDYRPTPPDVDRKLAEIAPEEIVNAFIAIITNAGVIERSELVGITATLFGMSRVTAQARTHLDSVLRWAIDQEEVLASGDLIELAPPPTNQV